MQVEPNQQKPSGGDELVNECSDMAVQYTVNSRYTQHSVYCAAHSGDTGTVAADNAA